MFTCLFLAFFLRMIIPGCVICFVFTRVLFIRKLRPRLLTSLENTEIEPIHLSSVQYSEIFYGPEKLSPRTSKCTPFSKSLVQQNQFRREKIISENVGVILEFVPDMFSGASLYSSHFEPAEFRHKDVHSQAWLGNVSQYNQILSLSWIFALGNSKDWEKKWKTWTENFGSKFMNTYKT